MRVVAGTLRGRRLRAPQGLEVRPTSERTREALFSLLEAGRLSEGRNPLPDAHVLDAFAGTGALGLEALTRGAGAAVCLERARPAAAVLRDNLRALGLSARAEVLECDALHPPPARRPAGLAFLDPPYRERLAAEALRALAAAGWLAPDSLVVVEGDKRDSFAPPEGFTLLERRLYGKAQLSFLRLQL
jgi:16S rRNA (guanine966-N2)-methyltransferase